MINMYKVLAFLTVISLVAACETTTPDPSGQLMSISDLGGNPGYSWYQTEIASYTPDASMVDSIVSNFQPADEKVCIFVRPSCGCRGTQRLFPQIMKTLMDAKLDTSKIEIWSMRNPSDKTPYSSTLELTTLPSIVVIKNGVESARIVDADYNEVNADTLIANAIVK